MAVSATLNGTGRNVKVSPEKAERIRKIARDLRYRPNHIAQSLRNRRTGMVGVVFQHFERLGEAQPYYPQLLNGVMAALFPADYTLALCPRLITGDDASPVSDGRFDGVLWCRPDLTETSVDLLQTASVPVVTMHAPPGAVPGVPAFCADNGGAMAKVVAHLKELGHRRVAFVIDLVNPNTVEGIVRREAFLAEASRAGLEGEILVWDEPYAEIAGLKTGIVTATALVCFSDTIGGGILAACDRFGVSVPRDVSVVGFDSSPFCDGTRPRLTSVNQPVERMALAATRHLLDLIRESDEGLPPSPTVSFVYDCGLDLRESTARPRTH